MCFRVCRLLFHLVGTCSVALRSLLDSAAMVEGVTACSSSPISGGCHHSKSSQQLLAPQLLQREAGWYTPACQRCELGGAEETLHSCSCCPFGPGVDLQQKGRAGGSVLLLWQSPCASPELQDLSWGEVQAGLKPAGISLIGSVGSVF